MPCTITPLKHYIMARPSRHSINISEVKRATGLSRSTIYHALAEPSRARPETLEVLRAAGVRLLADVAVIVPPTIDEFALEEDLTYREVRQLLRVRLKPVERLTKDELRHVWRSAKEFPAMYSFDTET